MYFQTAGIEASPFLLIAVAFSISFFTSMGGVSGAFLLLPFQMSVLGFTSPAVSATNQVFNIVAIPAGLRRFNREGRLVLPLVMAVAIGSMPGVVLGVYARVRFLPDPGRFKIFAGGVLLVIGIRMLVDLFRIQAGSQKRSHLAETAFRKRISSGSSEHPPAVTVYRLTPLWVEFEFLDHRFRFNVLGIACLSFVVGAIGGAYGMGGGSILAPFFIAVLALPVYAVAGAALAGTLVTSLTAVAVYRVIAPLYPQLAVAPDWKLGFFLGVGGALGIWLGARCQKLVPPKIIKSMLTAIVLFTAIKYVSAILF